MPSLILTTFLLLHSALLSRESCDIRTSGIVDSIPPATIDSSIDATIAPSRNWGVLQPGVYLRSYFILEPSLGLTLTAYLYRDLLGVEANAGVTMQFAVREGESPFAWDLSWHGILHPLPIGVMQRWYVKGGMHYYWNFLDLWSVGTGWRFRPGMPRDSGAGRGRSVWTGDVGASVGWGDNPRTGDPFLGVWIGVGFTGEI